MKASSIDTHMGSIAIDTEAIAQCIGNATGARLRNPVGIRCGEEGLREAQYIGEHSRGDKHRQLGGKCYD